MNTAQLITDRDRREWEAFCESWPYRMATAADEAFAEYSMGLRTRESFEQVVRQADVACDQHVVPFRQGVIPAWFKRRVKRVLGPRYFEHLKLSSAWLEEGTWGSAKLPLDVIAINPENPALHQRARQVYDVFVIEPIRPMLVSKTDELPRVMTEQLCEKIMPVHRKAFLDVLFNLLRQPMALAEAMRCRLRLERPAYSGWRRMRVVFVPYSVQEPDHYVAASFCQRNCRCHQCSGGPRGIKPPIGTICHCPICMEKWR